MLVQNGSTVVDWLMNATGGVASGTVMGNSGAYVVMA